MSIGKRCCALLGIVGFLGCSGAEPVGTVNGHVTLDGQPLSKGAINFDNRQTRFAVSANLDEQGAYVIRTAEQNGLPPGEYVVAISPATIGTGESPLVGDSSNAPNTQAKPIPKRYHSAATSGLSATVAVGENPPYDFQLTSDK